MKNTEDIKEAIKDRNCNGFICTECMFLDSTRRPGHFLTCSFMGKKLNNYKDVMWACKMALKRKKIKEILE